MTDFESLGLAEPILKALKALGYQTPTPIQAEAIPYLLQGRDLLGLAQTGTGKTAAFALPILHHILAKPKHLKPYEVRALVLAPTRELVSQIGDNFAQYGRHMGLRHAVIFGGVGQNRQIESLKKGVDVLVAAPGRLLDLVSQGFIDLSNTEFVVLDEADRMLDMGFIHDIRKVIKILPPKRQTHLFSATMPSSIEELAHSLLNEPACVQVTPESSTVDRIRQAVLFVDSNKKKEALLMLVDNERVERAVVFTLMKHEANKVADYLNENGISAAAIHGNKSQGARERAMSGFRDGSVKVLVATDIAARGIDVDEVSHVFNYDLPNIPESYVHRIGRTARAGREGWAITLCEAEQRAWLHDIEKRIGKDVPAITNHPYHSEEARLSTLRPPVLGGGRRQGRRSDRGAGGRGSFPRRSDRSSSQGTRRRFSR